MEPEIEAAVELRLESGQAPSSERVKELVREEAATVPQIAVLVIDLGTYGELLSAEVAR